jgi:hypothetical protein
MADGDDLTKENRINVKLGFEKKWNVAAYEHEIYNISLEGPADSLIAMKDMVKLLLPVVKNMKVVTIKAAKGESVDTTPQVQEVKKAEGKKDGSDI